MPFDISELLALYEVATLSFPEKLEDLREEIIEKATRLFGAYRLAIVVQKGERRKCLVRWGFRHDGELPDGVVSGENRFFYRFKNGVEGYLCPENKLCKKDKN